jgi:hypothetical protein
MANKYPVQCPMWCGCDDDLSIHQGKWMDIYDGGTHRIRAANELYPDGAELTVLEVKDGKGVITLRLTPKELAKAVQVLDWHQ